MGRIEIGIGLITAAMLGIAVTSCEVAEEPQEVTTEAQAPTLTVRSEVRSSPDVGTSWSYDAIGKRDPYRAYTDVVIPPTRTLTKLQHWELDQLRVVGILRKNGERVALIEDPRGEGHIVEAGTFVGTRWGRIERIADSEVVVAETYTDDYGRILPIEVSMRLPDPYPEG